MILQLRFIQYVALQEHRLATLGFHLGNELLAHLGGTTEYNNLCTLLGKVLN